MALAILSIPVSAENLQSPNYILVDPEVASSTGTSSSSNYKSLILSGSGIDYSQVSSTLYKVGSGHGYTFMANAPYIKCFETSTTSGTTECVSMPHGNGAIGECGDSGCYDRAIVQIDGTNNPTDTLYSIEITDDNWATVYVIDGSNHVKKPLSSKSILDYKTSSDWNASPWNMTNIRSLKSNTQYQVRATALNGDFTESPAGPAKSATTVSPSAVFDLDIGDAFTDETDVPYTVVLPAVKPESYVFSSTNGVIVEFSSNAQAGSQVFVKDTYSGLRSTSMLYLLASASEDLSSSSGGDGFGLQTVSKTQSAGSVGFVQSGTTYTVSGTSVGAVSTSNTLLGCSITSLSDSCGTGTPTFVSGAEILLSLGVRASLEAPAKADYSDVLTFTLVSGF